MLKTVLTRRSLVRLRPGRQACPFWRAETSVVSTLQFAGLRKAEHCFPRYFSVATTDETALPEPEATKIKTEEPQPATTKRNKKKRKDRPANRPTRKKSRKLFDLLAPHLPLPTLRAITRKLKNAAPKIAPSETTTTKLGQVAALLDKAKMDPWARARFTEYLMLKRFSKTKSTQQDYPVYINKREMDSHVELLMKARDLSAKKPLLWSRTQRRKEKKAAKAAAASASSDHQDESIVPPPDTDEQQDVLSIHEKKSELQRCQEAQELATLLAEHLPEKAFTNVMKLFTQYVQHPKQVKMLFSHLDKNVGAHLHFVVEQVGTFFHVKHSTVTADPRVVKREKEWQEAKGEFVDSILDIYDKLQESVVFEATRGLKGKNAEILNQLEELRTRPSDGVKVGRDRQQEQPRGGRRRKNIHIVFDAMLLQDDWDVSSSPQQQPQHTIFVDNLPIDMQETDLFDLYSRCGPVLSVKIFNQREELDPGPLTAKQRREKKVQQRMSSNKRRRWKRPRTPVYGQVTFTSQEGYDCAVDAPLRIFGMVVRKHPMRSIRPSDMMSLYLEDIPKGTCSLDIEHKLSSLLHPEIYVSLNMGQHDYAEPSSCEIKFPSFEIANHACHRLQELDLEGCSIQWMRTPEDAVKYWTREFSFET